MKVSNSLPSLFLSFLRLPFLSTSISSFLSRASAIGGMSPVSEVKLMLVGSSHAGKTSLIRCLRNDAYRYVALPLGLLSHSLSLLKACPTNILMLFPFALTYSHTTHLHILIHSHNLTHSRNVSFLHSLSIFFRPLSLCIAIFGVNHLPLSLIISRYLSSGQDVPRTDGIDLKSITLPKCGITFHTCT